MRFAAGCVKRSLYFWGRDVVKDGHLHPADPLLQTVERVIAKCHKVELARHYESSVMTWVCDMIHGIRLVADELAIELDTKPLPQKERERLFRLSDTIGKKARIR